MQNIFYALVVSLMTTFSWAAYAQSGLEMNGPLVNSPLGSASGDHSGSVGYRFAYLSVDSLLKIIGKPKSKEELNELGVKLKRFCEDFGFSVMLQNAVYVNQKYNITSLVVNYIQGKEVSTQQIESIPRVKGVEIGFVDISKFFKNSELAKESARLLAEEFSGREEELKEMTEHGETPELKRLKSKFIQDVNARKKQELDKILKLATEKVKEIAPRDNIDIVLQKVVYIDPQFNITDKLIAEMQ